MVADVQTLPRLSYYAIGITPGRLPTSLRTRTIRSASHSPAITAISLLASQWTRTRAGFAGLMIFAALNGGQYGTRQPCRCSAFIQKTLYEGEPPFFLDVVLDPDGNAVAQQPIFGVCGDSAYHSILAIRVVSRNRDVDFRDMLDGKPSERYATTDLPKEEDRTGSNSFNPLRAVRRTGLRHHGIAWFTSILPRGVGLYERGIEALRRHRLPPGAVATVVGGVDGK